MSCAENKDGQLTVKAFLIPFITWSLEKHKTNPVSLSAALVAASSGGEVGSARAPHLPRPYLSPL